MFGILKKIIGTKNDREIKRIAAIVDRINALEPGIASLSDAQLQAKTPEFRDRLNNGSSVDDLLPEAFAVCREASKRIMNMRHFDVQLIGGIVLHEGRIAEMKTGEGKTLVATLPVYLNSLDGRGVHVVTVNDYLARRDAQWMSPLYNFLGLSIGIIVHGLTDEQRQEAYGSDIAYGTNNEFGFDYLRDNMKFDSAQFVQRELNFAIVDEVDSILIDEARTPLIISGPSEESTDKYYRIDKIIPRLKRGEDYTVDEKARTVILTEDGNIRTEKLLGAGNLYDPANIELVHHVLQSLKAHNLFRKDVDYVVNDGEVIIVDEFTGRLMPGRRWSDGLHQAVEAKEGVKIENENQTLATITFQNFFRMYNKLGGMTGTAMTEAEEFAKIYELDVISIPTNREMIRIDSPDMIYKTEKGKLNAVIDDIEQCNKKGQPVLVGTISIEKSELLSSLLKKKEIRHSVLNAKYHDREAEIIVQAGRSSAVTIATNMAGRGTDIILGGNAAGIARQMLIDNPDHTEEDRQNALAAAEKQCEADREKVLEAGGLHIIGTERHEARRIDNQLRGRSGRQGDPGSSRFYLSLEDDLMRIFYSDRVSGLMGKLGMDDSMPIENKMVSKAIENAKKRVVSQNFDIRKHLLEYDDVMNKQRTEIYAFRREILEGADTKQRLLDMSEDVIDELVQVHCPGNRHADEWDVKGLQDSIFGTFDFTATDIPGDLESLRDMLCSSAREHYEKREAEIGSDMMRYMERWMLLQVVDSQWKDHLLAMDHLKEGIGLRGYAQRDPLVEYKKEAFSMFGELSGRIANEVVMRLFRIQIQKNQEERVKTSQQRIAFNYNRGDSGPAQPVTKGGKTGRNEPCPCGSGKKYKKCCGKNE